MRFFHTTFPTSNGLYTTFPTLKIVVNFRQPTTYCGRFPQKSDSPKFMYPNNRQRKTPENRSFPGKRELFYRLENWGARRAALRPYWISIIAFFPVLSRLFADSLPVFPYELTHLRSRVLPVFCWRLKGFVYYRSQFPRLIIFDLCVNVHSHLAILVSGQVLHRFRVNTFMNQIRDISVPEKMWCHIEIQCIVDALVRSASLTKLRWNGVVDFFAIDIPIDFSFLNPADCNVVP